MSLKTVNKKRTVCEVLREINDIAGSNPEIHNRLVEAEGMCKKMAKKLYEYNKDFDKGWWKKNPNYEKSLKARLKKRLIK